VAKSLTKEETKTDTPLQTWRFWQINTVIKKGKRSSVLRKPKGGEWNRRKPGKGDGVRHEIKIGCSSNLRRRSGKSVSIDPLKSGGGERK